jgi:hypothetical protein
MQLDKSILYMKEKRIKLLKIKKDRSHQERPRASEYQIFGS